MQTAEQNKEQLAFAPGDSVPWFATATHVRKEFHFDTVAGRYLVLCFYGSTKFEVSRKIIEEFYKVKGVLTT